MVRSKLPHIGTTIFTVMTNRARELGAINLAQGFPDYDPPEALKALVAEYVARGFNQYAPMIGVDKLREAIARRRGERHGRAFDSEAEVTVTLGATEAIFSSVLALVHPGDEVILFDPSYDSYAPAVLLAGGRPIHVPLQPPSFRIDWQRVEELLSPRTRLVMINTPHNPVATTLSTADLLDLTALIRDRPILVLSDEVYESMVFDGAGHASVLDVPELAERCIAVYSFGKTLHATGWRVGYAIASKPITREIRRVHQFNTFSIAAPLQYAIAEFMQRCPEHDAELTMFYQRKRDLFLEELRGTEFTWRPAQGSYFQLLDYSAFSAAPDVEFAERLLREAGVASIPISPFYAAAPRLSCIRLCFAKRESTLRAAAERLRAFRP